MSNEDLHKAELKRLINKGIPFEIAVKTRKRKPGFLGFFKKKIEVVENKSFLLKEPTLHKLDRVALESLKIDITGIESTENITAFVKNERYYETMAKIVAIIVADNESEEEGLKEIFFKALTPSMLNEIITGSDLMSNMPDFINSILSVAAVRTKTERIENKELPASNPLTDLEE